MPTCIVETSWESTSNNETQFNALCAEFALRGIINAKLDEKKSLNLIQHVFDLVQEMIGETGRPENNSDDDAYIEEKVID